MGKNLCQMGGAARADLIDRLRFYYGSAINKPSGATVLLTPPPLAHRLNTYAQPIG